MPICKPKRSRMWWGPQSSEKGPENGCSLQIGDSTGKLSMDSYRRWHLSWIPKMGRISSRSNGQEDVLEQKGQTKQACGWPLGLGNTTCCGRRKGWREFDKRQGCKEKLGRPLRDRNVWLFCVKFCTPGSYESPEYVHHQLAKLKRFSKTYFDQGQ